MRLRRRRNGIEITNIEAVRLHPDDVLVVSTAHAITQQDWDDVRSQLRAWFPANESVRLPPGWTVDVVRPEEAGSK